MNGSSRQGSIAKAGLMGGAVAAILHAAPFITSLNTCCCVLVIGSGLFSAWILQSDSGRSAGPGRCGTAGLLAGVIGGLVGVPLAAIVSRLAFGVGTLETRVEQTMMQMRSMIEAMGTAPGADAMVESVMRATVGLDFNTWTIVAMFVTSAIFAFFGLLGGILGGVLMRPAMPGGGGSMPRPPGGFPPPAPPGATAPPSASSAPTAAPTSEPASESGESTTDADERPLDPDELPLLPQAEEGEFDAPSAGDADAPSPGDSDAPSPGDSDAPSSGDLPATEPERPRD